MSNTDISKRDYHNDCSGDSLTPEWIENYKEAIKQKWLHVLDCRDCTARFSTVVYIPSIHYADWRVTVCEFLKAIGLTAQMTALFPDGPDTPFTLKNRCVRTVFGILSEKVKKTRKGFAFTIEMSAADRSKRSGAKIFAEMVGICAINFAGKGPTKVSISTHKDGKDIGAEGNSTKAFGFNQGNDDLKYLKSFICNQGKLKTTFSNELNEALVTAFSTVQDKFLLRAGDVVSLLLDNSGEIFVDLLIMYDNETLDSMSPCFIGNNECAQEMQKQFYASGVITFCNRCNQEDCPVNNKMVQWIAAVYFFCIQYARTTGNKLKTYSRNSVRH